MSTVPLVEQMRKARERLQAAVVLSPELQDEMLEKVREFATSIETLHPDVSCAFVAPATKRCYLLYLRTRTDAPVRYWSEQEAVLELLMDAGVYVNGCGPCTAVAELEAGLLAIYRERGFQSLIWAVGSRGPDSDSNKESTE